MDPQFPLPSHNEGNGQVAIDMPGCDMNAPFGAPAPWDAANGQDQKQDYMLYVWIGLGVVVVIILLVCCCGGGKSGSSGKSRSFLSRLNPFAKEEPESCCSKPAVKYGVPALALATAVGGFVYYKKRQADTAARKKEQEDSEFAVKVWTISGVVGSVVLGAIWCYRATVTGWLRLLGNKCGMCDPPKSADAGAAKSGKGIMATIAKPFKCFKSKLCSAKPGQGANGAPAAKMKPDPELIKWRKNEICPICKDSWMVLAKEVPPIEVKTPYKLCKHKICTECFEGSKASLGNDWDNCEVCKESGNAKR